MKHKKRLKASNISTYIDITSFFNFTQNTPNLTSQTNRKNIPFKVKYNLIYKG